MSKTRRSLKILHCRAVVHLGRMAVALNILESGKASSFAETGDMTSVFLFIIFSLKADEKLGATLNLCTTHHDKQFRHRGSIQLAALLLQNGVELTRRETNKGGPKWRRSNWIESDFVDGRVPLFGLLFSGGRTVNTTLAPCVLSDWFRAAAKNWKSRVSV